MRKSASTLSWGYPRHPPRREPRRRNQEDLDIKLRDDLIRRCLNNFSCTVTTQHLVSKTGSEVRRRSLVEIPLDDSFEDQTITHIRVPLPGYDIDGTPAYFMQEKTEVEEREMARRRRINRFMGGAKVGIENDKNARKSASKRRRSVPIEYCNTDRRDVPRFCAICLSKISIGERVTWSSKSECAHIFHTDCMEQWLSALGKKNVKSLSGPPTKEQLLKGLDCPCCRQPFISSSTILARRKH